MAAKTYYIASAKCYHMVSYTGTVMTEENDEVWLGMDAGYPSCSRNKSDAHKFQSAETVRRDASRWDGSPWYNRLKPGSLRVFRVAEERIVTREEVEVTE